MYCIFVYGLHVCMHVRIHTCEFELIQFSKILICRTHPIFAQKSPEFLEDPVAPPRVKWGPWNRYEVSQKTVAAHVRFSKTGETPAPWHSIDKPTRFHRFWGQGSVERSWCAQILRTALLLVCGISGNECVGMCGNDYLWNLLVCRMCRNEELVVPQILTTHFDRVWGQAAGRWRLSNEWHIHELDPRTSFINSEDQLPGGWSSQTSIHMHELDLRTYFTNSEDLMPGGWDSVTLRPRCRISGHLPCPSSHELAQTSHELVQTVPLATPSATAPLLVTTRCLIYIYMYIYTCVCACVCICI